MLVRQKVAIRFARADLAELVGVQHLVAQTTPSVVAAISQLRIAIFAHQKAVPLRVRVLLAKVQLVGAGGLEVKILGDVVNALLHKGNRA